MASVNFDEILQYAADKGTSDIHISTNRPLFFRLHGKMYPQEQIRPTLVVIESWLFGAISERQKLELRENRSTDASYVLPSGLRFRLNAYYTKEGIAVALRVISEQIPQFSTLGLPHFIREQAISLKQGLILVVGPTGHGKSTTLASLLNERIQNKSEHVITLEDPIEFILDNEENKTCLVHQREKGSNFIEFSDGIRASLREDPDVLLVGEMRDLDTISTAVTAAETGHLVFSTLHTNSAPETISRIIDAFPEGAKNQIQSQLAASVSMIVSQRLLPAVKGGRVPCYEIMTGSYAIKNHIRQNSIHQIHNSMQTDDSGNMITFDHTLAQLYLDGSVTWDTAVENVNQMDNFENILENLQSAVN